MTEVFSAKPHVVSLCPLSDAMPGLQTAPSVRPPHIHLGSVTFGINVKHVLKNLNLTF